MAIAYLIPAEGTPSRIDERITAKVLKAAIGGGFLQAIPVRGFAGATMYMDEEGKIKPGGPLPVNRVATALCRIGTSIFLDDVINGDVIVVGVELPGTSVIADCDSTVGDALESLAGVEL